MGEDLAYNITHAKRKYLEKCSGGRGENILPSWLCRRRKRTCGVLSWTYIIREVGEEEKVCLFYGKGRRNKKG